MNMRHLKIFVAVCEEGSVTKAAEKLYIAQPTVSFAISELESRLDTKLFDRMSRRLHLTDAGKKLLPYAVHTVSMFENIQNGNWYKEENDILNIGSSVTIGSCILPGLIKKFEKSSPHTEIKVKVDNSNIIEQWVLENKIDFGLIEGVSHSPQLINDAFLDDELVLLLSPRHPWAKQSFVSPSQLEGEPFLMRERGSGGREILESALYLQGIEIQPAWESISTQAIVRAVEHGLGVTVLPLLLVEDNLKKGTLITKTIQGISLQRKFAVIHHKDKYLTDKAAEFIGLCHGCVR